MPLCLIDYLLSNETLRILETMEMEKTHPWAMLHNSMSKVCDLLPYSNELEHLSGLSVFVATETSLQYRLSAWIVAFFSSVVAACLLPKKKRT